MYILGGIDDQINLHVWSRISSSPFTIDNPYIAAHEPYKIIFSGMMNPLQTSRPILETIVSVGLSLFGPNFLWFMNLFFIVLAFLGAYLLFKRFKLGVVYALIFTLSTYMWVHLGIHLSLMPIFVFPVFLYTILRFQDSKTNLKHGLFLGLFLAAVILTTNYYGFILLLFWTTYLVVKVALDYLYEKSFNCALIKKYLVSIFSAFLVSAIFLFPFIQDQYFSDSTFKKATGAGFRQERPYEDFFSFSSRPWYFVLPHEKSIVWNGVSKDIQEKLDNWDYFLADDYFANEHSANFFGYLFLIFVVFVTLFSFIKGSKEVRKNIALFGIIALVLIAFMMPPFITISGIQIPTPGALLYKTFPMFRVTARIGIVVLLLFLYLLGLGMQFLFEEYTQKEKLLSAFLIILSAVTIIETFVPVKVEKVDTAPKEYFELNANTPPGTEFAVYPYAKTTEAFFWLPVHERNLVNPRGYKTPTFDSEMFTKSLAENGFEAENVVILVFD